MEARLKRSADEFAASPRDDEHGLPDVGVGVSAKASKSRTSQLESPEWDFHPVSHDDGVDNSQELLRQFFDSESALQELNAAFESRKRTGDDAFNAEFGFWGGSGKRRHIELPQHQDTESPLETPSLSSPESFLRPDQGETAPHTPAGEAPHSPSSLLNAYDPLFDDPDFDFGTINDELPLDFELAPHLAHEDKPAEGKCENKNENPVDRAVHTVQFMDDNATEKLLPELSSTSEATKQRFSLEIPDLANNANREVLQRVCPQQEYTSPYPVYQGPLGYLPSAPGVHVKYLEVAEDQVNDRFLTLNHRVRQLSYERTKYRNAWFRWNTTDSKTGKTREQALRDETALHRRLSSQRQSKAEQHRKEAEEWKQRFYDLSTVYNNLLYEINVQRTMPAVAPTPQGYRPQGTPQAVSGPQPASGPSSQPQSQGHSRPVSRGQPAMGPLPPQSTQPAPANPAPRDSRPVTIDLTDEPENKTPNPVPAPTPSPEQQQRRNDLLRSLQNKEYGWLKDMDHSDTHHRATSTPRTFQSGTTAIPERSHSYPPDHGSDARTDSENDEMVRAMEEELAQG
ncbi:uncharacterized protein BDW47DRAFT_109664 [Aspergillus candidus]|uniref:Uncharacterized protein n=1 Tax=Aspergillus candidus TaxID=41067 RepID=A0A2I2F5D0_ASPCN|nr:hypothetical protein BDW47DRAFT_109664 [Aspergillus candidus]PLB35875.1 hypothetical protein BDW47DRAFT_109664 [Aspergillus candidus]